MVTFEQFMKLVKYQVFFSNHISDTLMYTYYGEFGDCTMAFDPKTLAVCVVSVTDHQNKRVYRMFDQASNVIRESSDESFASDLYIVDLDDDVDFIEKAHAIIDGEPYDTRVTIALDLPDDEVFELMKMAHERDMTFNQFVVQVMEQAITLAENKSVDIDI